MTTTRSRSRDLAEKARIVRIDCGPEEYLRKEELWDHLDAFVDNTMAFYADEERTPDIVHSHYADAGYAGVRLSSLLGVPLVHTGHSLGRVKRRRLLASGLTGEAIEQRYNMTRRIDAEEETLAAAELVVVSTANEIEEQYGIYDHYQPEQMRVVPPGTDLTRFRAPDGSEREQPIWLELRRFLAEPDKPIVLALARPDERKNLVALVEAYGESEALRAAANLVIVAGSRDDLRETEDTGARVQLEILLAIDSNDLYGKVAFPKQLTAEDVAHLYRLAASSGGLFINPALTEPFGLTLIEAAASGLPIVATEDGGPRDIIANCSNGLLIDPLDSEAMTSANARGTCRRRALEAAVRERPPGGPRALLVVVARGALSLRAATDPGEGRAKAGAQAPSPADDPPRSGAVYRSGPESARRPGVAAGPGVRVA